MNHIRIPQLITLVSFLITSALYGNEETKMDLYLLIGQSNMAGRGEVEPQDREIHPRVWTLDKNQQWVSAQDPIHFDKKRAGVGLGRSFGITMAEQDSRRIIGLIPCAVGGTSIRKWRPGVQDTKTKVYPYDDMLARLRVALESGTVKGILWHQGEADGKMGERGQYAAALTELIQRVRAECGSQDIPFVIGQLGQFEGRPWSSGRILVDEAQRNVAAEVSRCSFVTSAGLKDVGDLTHFNAEALRELGRRYAQQMIQLQSICP